jgi:hypothetical protein
MLTKKTLLSIAAVVTVVAPLVPDKININFNIPVTVAGKPDKPYEIVTTTCHLSDRFRDDRGHQVCEYTCTEGDNKKVHKVTYNSGAMCQSSISERVKKTKR